MSEIECPKCGRLGSVPKDKQNSRLVCKKCLSVFHITPTGRVLLGEVPDHKYEEHMQAAALAAEKKHRAVDVVADYNVGRTGVLVGILALGLVCIGALIYFSKNSSKEYLEFKGRSVAEALVADDIKFVMQNSAKEGASDVNQWFANVQPMLAELKKESARKELETLVMVIEEDFEGKKGQVEVAYRQTKGTSRSELIAKEAGAKPTGRTSLTVPIYWVNEGGKWVVDGKKTLTAASTIH